VVVTDFGIASQSLRGEDTLAAGSPDYMAPEQREGREPTPACDIYSLGIIAHELVTGERPEAGRPIEHTKLPRRWRRAIERCLSVDPGRRYATAPAFAGALQGSAERILDRRNWLLISSGAVMTGAASFIESRSRRISGARLGTLSIAVMPFETGENDLRPLARGIAGDLIRALATSPVLHVTAEPSVQAAIGGTDSWGDAARRLGVQHVLSGRLRRAGPDVVIETWLRNATDRTVEWEQAIAVPSAQLVQVPAAIARSAAAAMRVQLGPAMGRAFSPPQAVSNEAYEEYLLGRAAALNRSEASLTESVLRYQAALRLAPEYAAAYAGMALSLNILAGTSRHPLQLTFQQAEEAAHRALEIDVSMGEAYLALASIAQRKDWDWDLSERRYGSALAFSPGLAMAHQWRSGLLSILRRPADAVAEAERACALDPLALPPKAALSGMLYRARRYADAVRQLRLILQLNREYQPAWDGMGSAYRLMGDYDASFEAHSEAVRLSNRAPAYLAGLGELFAVMGRQPEALAILAELEQRWPAEQFYPWSLVEVHRGLGNVDEAFRWMDVAVTQRDPNTTILVADPANDIFRGDARFVSYVQALKL